MGSQDLGAQILSYDFKNPGESESFNRINYITRQEGIYSGAEITKISDTVIEVSPFVAHIVDTENSIGVRVETQVNARINCTSSTPFVIIRFNWLNIENNFADISAVSETNITSEDLIVGKLVFSGATLTENFDYSRKSIAKPIIQSELLDYFKVIPTEPYSNTVDVSSGKAIIDGILVNFTGATSPALSDSSSAGRKDILTINSSGALTWYTGTDTTPPVYPVDEYTLVEVHRTGTRTDIKGYDLIDVRNYQTIFNLGTASTKDITISSSSPSGGNDGDLWIKV